MALAWSSSGSSLPNYQRYPDVTKALLSMLSESKLQPEVYELHLQMLKSLIMRSIWGLEGKADLAFLYKRQADEAEPEEEAERMAERELSTAILKEFISDIAHHLNGFCSNNLAELKKTMITKTKHKFNQKGVKPTAHEVKNQTIKDLVFVMSEVAQYLPSGEPLNASETLFVTNTDVGFLEMMVSIVSMRSLHAESAHNAYYEELLHFGVKSVGGLLAKAPGVDDKLLDRICQLFLLIRPLRVRQGLATSLQASTMLSAPALQAL